MSIRIVTFWEPGARSASRDELREVVFLWHDADQTMQGCWPRMKLYYSDHFTLPLPPDHRFPMAKYALLRARVAETLVPPHHLLVPPPATDQQLRLVHTDDYLQCLAAGQLSAREIRRIGFPWSPQLVERSRRSTGGTIAACHTAFNEGVSVNLAGGTHHAFPDHGQGYCVFNDVAVAARVMQQQGIQHVLILDCDVHQGNGTAAIFAGDPSVFTFSIHGERNFPFRKEASDLDIALEDGTDDAAYLDNLELGLEQAFALAPAQLVIYLAGADPFRDDTLGRLALSKEGLRQRDTLVIAGCRSRGIPLAIVMSGGYAKTVSDIVDIHFQTIQVAAAHLDTGG